MSKYKVGDEIIIIKISPTIYKKHIGKIGRIQSWFNETEKSLGFYMIKCQNLNFLLFEDEFIPATETNKILFCK